MVRVVVGFDVMGMSTPKNKEKLIIGNFYIAGMKKKCDIGSPRPSTPSNLPGECWKYGTAAADIADAPGVSNTTGPLSGLLSSQTASKDV